MPCSISQSPIAALSLPPEMEAATRRSRRSARQSLIARSPLAGQPFCPALLCAFRLIHAARMAVEVKLAGASIPRSSRGDTDQAPASRLQRGPGLRLQDEGLDFFVAELAGRTGGGGIQERTSVLRP